MATECRPGRLEEAISLMTEVFLKYAGEEGKKKKLCKAELAKLLDKEINCPELKTMMCADDIDKAFEKMDLNENGEVKFAEFCHYVSKIAREYYKIKHGKAEKKDKDQHECEQKAE